MGISWALDAFDNKVLSFLSRSVLVVLAMHFLFMIMITCVETIHSGRSGRTISGK